MQTKCNWCNITLNYSESSVNKKEQIKQDGNTMRVVVFKWVSCPQCERDVKVE